MRWIDAHLSDEIEVADPTRPEDPEETTVADLMAALKASMGFVEDLGPAN